jgi:hypothetical protein
MAFEVSDGVSGLSMRSFLLLLGIVFCAGCQTRSSCEAEVYSVWRHRAEGALYTIRDLDSGNVQTARAREWKILASSLTQMNVESGVLSESDLTTRSTFVRRVLDYLAQHAADLKNDRDAALVLSRVERLLTEPEDRRRIDQIRQSLTTR